MPSIISEAKAPGYAQWVQMVTQVAQKKSDAHKFAADPAFWYPAAHFMRNGFHPLTRVDYAVNVWSPRDHLTGYVIKRQHSDPHELPHVAYLMDDDTLLWVTFRQDYGKHLGSGTETKIASIFAEYGTPRSGPRPYYIRGMLVELIWDGAADKFTFGAHRQVSQHRGDYAFVSPAKHANAPKPKPAPKIMKPLGPP